MLGIQHVDAKWLISEVVFKRLCLFPLQLTFTAVLPNLLSQFSVPIENTQQVPLQYVLNHGATWETRKC